MEIKKILLIICVCAGICHATKFAVTIGAAKAVYNGDGYMFAKRAHNNTWDIQISGLAGSTSSAATLKISPTEKYPSDVFINSITADGSLNSIKVELPPGTQFANYVRNIFVDGNVKNITFTGADLGASDGQDGLVVINGSLNSINIKGKKIKPFKGANFQFWGGNIWADIVVSNGINKILTKGGNIYYDAEGGILGNIFANGILKLLYSKGVVVKINKNDPTSKIMFGGGISANVNVGNNEIKTIKSKGGIISNGKISCRQLKQLKVLGQKSSDSRPIISPENQGLNKICVEVGIGSSESYKDCSLKQLIVKNGSIRDSIFSAKGDIKTFKTIGEIDSGMGGIYNSVARAGVDGSISTNQLPDIFPDNYITSLQTKTELIIPFIVDSADSNEILTTRIKYRGTALNSVISNFNGETFFGTNRWKISTYPQTGMFVWTTVDEDQGVAPEITVRVRDNSTPNLYDDLSIVVSLFASNVAPTISVVPSDNPRIFNLAYETLLDWKVTAFDLDFSDPLTFSVENDSMGLVISNISDKFYNVFSTNNNIGFYSNIVFKVSDSSGLTDSETISVNVISNFSPTVWTTCETNYFERAPGNPLNFFVVAKDTELTDLTFQRPANLPDTAVYSNRTISTDIPLSNIFHWTPQLFDTGTFNWAFLVYDSHDVSLSSTVTITGKVTNQFYNPAASTYKSNFPKKRQISCRNPRFSVIDTKDKLHKQSVISSFSRKWLYHKNTLKRGHLQLAAAPTYHPGNINNVIIADSAIMCKFIAGVNDNGNENWSAAAYLGKIKKVKINGKAESNTFVSAKDIKVPKNVILDFNKNEVWINGTKK